MTVKLIEHPLNKPRTIRYDVGYDINVTSVIEGSPRGLLLRIEDSWNFLVFELIENENRFDFLLGRFEYEYDVIQVQSDGNRVHLRKHYIKDYPIGSRIFEGTPPEISYGKLGIKFYHFNHRQVSLKSNGLEVPMSVGHKLDLRVESRLFQFLHDLQHVDDVSRHDTFDYMKETMNNLRRVVKTIPFNIVKYSRESEFESEETGPLCNRDMAYFWSSILTYTLDDRH